MLTIFCWGWCPSPVALVQVHSQHVGVGSFRSTRNRRSANIVYVCVLNPHASSITCLTASHRFFLRIITIHEIFSSISRLILWFNDEAPQIFSHMYIFAMYGYFRRQVSIFPLFEHRRVWLYTSSHLCGFHPTCITLPHGWGDSGPSSMLPWSVSIMTAIQVWFGSNLMMLCAVDFFPSISP